MFACVGTVVDPSTYGRMAIGSFRSCADQVTGMIADHQLENNQTAINIARAYLKTQGIQ
ncbi:MAG: hypothetical protein WBQ25_07580 [Nitrososphaeraceae archaeon]